MGSMVTVRLKRLDASNVEQWLRESSAPQPSSSIRALGFALEAALRPTPRRSQKARHFALQAKEAKSLKRSTKREETRAIWNACWKRCGGICECGCGGYVWRLGNESALDHSMSAAATLDHFRGRARVKQSVENCWILRSDCHREKTREHPDKATWLWRFIVHAERHQYGFWAEEARKVLEGSVAVKADEKRRRSGPQSSSPVEK